MTLRSIALALIALAAAQAAAQTPSPAPPAKSTALTPPKTKLKLVQVNPVGWPTTAYLDEGSLVDKTGPNNTRLKELWLLEGLRHCKALDECYETYRDRVCAFFDRWLNDPQHAEFGGQQTAEALAAR